mgnify:FL=1
MDIEKLLQKIKVNRSESSEEFLELDESKTNEENKVGVMVQELRDFLDTDRIQQLVRDGNVVFVKIKDLRNRDVTELKKSVDKLRKMCLAMNGDIAGIDEDFLVLTPSFAKVYRGEVA